ncbi:hypothetical protein ACLBWZ_14775 [Brucellaceae bacterium C25G]
MTSIIQTEAKHLKAKAEEIRAKIEELMHKPETPDYDEKIGDLNSTLDNIMNQITLDEN